MKHKLFFKWAKEEKALNGSCPVLKDAPEHTTTYYNFKQWQDEHRDRLTLVNSLLINDKCSF